MLLPLIDRASRFSGKISITDVEGRHTYGQLLKRARAVANALLAVSGGSDLDSSPVALMASPSCRFAAGLYGIWMAGGMAVPLCFRHPDPELLHVLRDSGAIRVLADRSHYARLRALAPSVTLLESLEGSSPTPKVEGARRALMLYTSGTTSRPKGVVMTHRNVQAMIEAMVTAWGWRSEDSILHTLPLHHTHGLVNALLTCLWVGARCEMMDRFDAAEVWRRFRRNTVFMAVPTIFRMLLDAWRTAPEAERRSMEAGAAGLRLMVSGSDALLKTLFEEWEKVTGHRLLERYGMTEIGMALSNPLLGERRAGTVGQPMPDMDVRLVDAADKVVAAEGIAGEIQVKGPSVFLEYWGHPGLTLRAFSDDGWFKTGDVGVAEGGYYRILGRLSVDVIKTGGFKVYAREVEEVLCLHPAVDQCAVVGIPDRRWGERVCAAVVSSSGQTLQESVIHRWAKKQLAHYKVPSLLMVTEELPCNVMGKVSKPALQRMFGDA